MRNFTNRSVAVLATLGVAAAGLVGTASVAQAATTTVGFSCAASILEDQKFSLTVEPKIPATVEQGKAFELGLDGTVTAPASTIGIAYGLLQGRALAGDATVDAKVGTTAATLSASLPKTDMPATGDMAIAVKGTGSVTLSELGSHPITVSGFTAPLKMTKADNTVADVLVTCVAEDPSAVIGSVEVVKAAAPKASRTTVSAKYTKRTKKITASAKVTSSKKAASGKVRFTLKRGKATIKSSVKTLNRKGTAAVGFTKITKRGTYTVTARYLGSKTAKASTRTIRVTVR